VGSDEFVVLHQQDPLGRTVDRDDMTLRPVLLRRRRRLRQIEQHGRSRTRFGTNVHMPARLFDEAVDHAQAEAASLADVLRGEERLEGPRHGLCVHADPGVRYRNDDVAFGYAIVLRRGDHILRIGIRGLYDEAAAGRHGVACIKAEVQDRILQLAGVDHREPEGGGEVDLDFDMLAERASQQIPHAGNQGVGIDRPGIEPLPPREGEQPVSQGCASLCRPPDRGCEIVGVASGRQLFLQQFCASQDHRQKVVEIMRDATGQLADRLELLRLAQAVVQVA